MFYLSSIVCLFCNFSLTPENSSKFYVFYMHVCVPFSYPSPILLDRYPQNIVLSTILNIVFLIFN